MKGSKALLRMLEDRGVRNVFGYPGATVIPIYDEFLESDVRHILVRHEQCAAHMADGYARASGKPGVCLATSGPGTTNLVTGIATAYADSIPMIALTGQVGTSFLGAEAFQEVDSYSLMMPVTKHNFRVLDPERLPHAIDEGWKICQMGRPGPVHIDMPVDQINSDIDSELLTKSWGVKPPAEDLSGMSDAVSLIRSAERPIMLVGGGAVNASEEVVKLAELTGMPIVTTLMSLGVVPSEHPLNLGPLGMHGRMGALDAFQSADLVLAIGTKMSDRTYNPHTMPAETCRVIQIDVDATQFGKSKLPSVNIQCDAKKGTRMLLDRLRGYKDAHSEWDGRYTKLRKLCQCDFDYDADPILPQKVMHEINRLLADRNTIVTTDVGQNQMWAMHCLDVRYPRQFITSGSFGTMGFGLPAALGAKVARPEAKVLTIVGDGGLQMVIQELATSVAEDIPVTIVLLNNGWLGMVRQWQKLFWNKRYSGTKLDADPDFVKIAESYGAWGIRVTKSSEIREALERGIKSDITCLIDIHCDPEADITPMILQDPKVPIVMGRCPYRV
ncbi:MAG: biosynthetic-type acetolactate synthase large subunit [Candidatus Methanomethylophilus sp.]|jgi:acetolactate synthase-1/2/3 large subunit|nr:biosynthetic-type acetolactate synthase large subunit [Methanomethylophilus sp.]MCI2075534.1 biosynthetic-type acetolactate synthase large subunit [Methanomethylophilus sp.]MCI2093356.1 biosynthetic-type acetolactate synthase large subunit [Methanomethylophilus sp.]WII08776.1 biosynthetic-type acetolactate synthase large subunit [Methanomassiliicoccales archaeon LGM-DZ1]